MDGATTTEPWLGDERWRDGRARSSALAELFPLWFGTVCFAAIVTPLIVSGWDRVTEAGPLAVGAVGFFSLIGTWMAVQAVLHTLAWRRFGRLEIALDPFPGSLGGHVGGAIDVLVPMLDPEDARIVLSCVQVKITRTRDRRRRWESVVWSREQRPAVEPGPRGVRLRYTFEVPDDLPATEPASDLYHHWSVRVTARVPGLDLDRAVEVPVHRTAEPLRASRAVETPTHRPEVTVPGQPATLGGGVRVAPTAEGVRVRYPPARERLASLMMLVFGLVFAGFGVGFWMAGARFAPDGAVGWLTWSVLGVFLVVFGGVGVLLVAMGLWALGNSLEVRIERGTVATTRCYLGLPCQRRETPVADIARIEIVIESQIGQGGKAEVGYRMDAHLVTGGRLRLGDGIRGTPAAEHLADIMAGATGITPKIVLREKGGVARGEAAA